MSPLSKIVLRRIRDRKRAKDILVLLNRGTGDLYENYRALYGLWTSNNAAVQELRPLFRIPGIDADGRLSVTDEFKTIVQSLAQEILPLISDPEAYS